MRYIITKLSLLSVLASATLSAQLTLDFTDSRGTFAGSLGESDPVPFYELGSLTDGTPTESDPGGQLDSRTTPSGSLSITDNAATFGFFYDQFNTHSVLAGTLTANSVGSSSMASNSSGIGSANGDIQGGGENGIYFQFDLSNFEPGFNLRITGVTATSTAGAGGGLELFVGSASYDSGTAAGGILTSSSPSYDLGGLSGSGLTIDVTDGDYVIFRNTSAFNADTFRLTNLTFEATVVPEPSSFALLAGLCSLTWLMIRRR